MDLDVQGIMHSASPAPHIGANYNATAIPMKPVERGRAPEKGQRAISRCIMQARALTAMCRRQALTFVETDKPFKWLEGKPCARQHVGVSLSYA